MANGFTILTSRDNTFFTNNKMTIGSGIPTSGSYKVGDIVISNSQADGIFGWVCTREGSPGNWEVIGSGAGSGGGGVDSVLVEYSNVVEFRDARTSIDIGISEYNKETDILEVHYNGLLLAEGVHYSINGTGTTITNLNGSWNANADDTQAMIFVVRKSTAGLNVVPIRNVVDINNATMEVEMGIGNFNPASDIISVHLNGVLLMQDIDYRIENGKLIKVDRSEAWNPNNVVGQKMYIEVLRNKGSVNEPDIGSIRKEHLTSELAAEINNNTNSINSLTGIANDHTTLINNLTEQVGNIDFSEVEAKIGNLPSLQTNAKNSLVDAVNELFQSANNGKELIANAIGEPLVSTDTFSAMSTNINSLLSTFKTNMMNNGVSVAGTDKFKQLIDKIATLADNEGKGIQYASGNIAGNYNIGQDDDGNVLSSQSYTLNADFGFIPTLLFVYCNTYYSYNTTQMSGVVVSNLADFVTATTNSGEGLSISNITENSFDLKLKHYGTKPMYIENLDWYAIGVGEEDTTLRDSLASILEEEGVIVTEEDDMASLISKVDSEFDRQVVPAGNAVASDVASGKTFMNNTGELITGTGTSYLNLLKNGGDETKYTKKIDTVNNGSITLTHYDTYLRINGYGSSYQTARCWMTINEAVDLTNINMILFDFYIAADISALSYMYYKLGVYEGTGEYNENVTLVKELTYNTSNYYQTPLRRAKYVLDVSECTGTHKIGIYFGVYGTNSGYLNLYNVEMI